MKDNKFVIDSFDQIKALFEKCNENESDGFYDVKQ